MTYARPFNILQNMSFKTQQLLLQYFKIYYTTINFHNIRFSILSISKTPRFSSHLEKKHEAEAFSPFAIGTKQIHIILIGEQPIFQGVSTRHRTNISFTSNVGAISDFSDPLFKSLL